MEYLCFTFKKQLGNIILKRKLQRKEMLEQQKLVIISCEQVS